MRFLKIGVKKLILEVDIEGLRSKLRSDPSLANSMIRCGAKTSDKSHPLHYICDCVFENIISDHEALDLARVYIENGSNIDGHEKRHLHDTPLVAACSLHADQVALYYINNNADIHHQGCHGGTPLHWAAWTGADGVVARLLQEKDIVNNINLRCEQFKSTPLFWGFHGYKNGGVKNQRNQYRCCELLLKSGADTSIPNADNLSIIGLLNDPKDKDYVDLIKRFM